MGLTAGTTSKGVIEEAIEVGEDGIVGEEIYQRHGVKQWMSMCAKWV